jgi:hypothetical protein
MPHSAEVVVTTPGFFTPRISTQRWRILEETLRALDAA